MGFRGPRVDAPSSSAVAGASIRALRAEASAAWLDEVALCARAALDDRQPLPSRFGCRDTDAGPLGGVGDDVGRSDLPSGLVFFSCGW